MEIHLLDIAADLYDRRMEVFLVERIRDEKMFASAEMLRRQIETDVKKARKIL